MFTSCFFHVKILCFCLQPISVNPHFQQKYRQFDHSVYCFSCILGWWRNSTCVSLSPVRHNPVQSAGSEAPTQFGSRCLCESIRIQMHGPCIKYKITPTGSLSSSQPGRPPYWTGPLAFCLIGHHWNHTFPARPSLLRLKPFPCVHCTYTFLVLGYTTKTAPKDEQSPFP